MPKSRISRFRRTADGCNWWPKRFTTSFAGRTDCKRRIIQAVQTLKVDVGHTSYPITIGPGLLGDRALLDSLIRGRDLCLVTNTTVAPLYLERLRDTLSGRRIAQCVLPDGEQHQTRET